MDEPAILERAQRAIEEKVFPGCVIGIVRQNGTSAVLPLGNLTYEASSPLVVENTIYDLASVTKSIPIASVALLFTDENPPRLNLADTVVRYLPELQNDFGATIEDLLRYRVKGPQMSSLKYRTFQEVRTHIFEKGFDGPAGESVYTNLPAFLLGIILERVSGKILPALANEYCFEPLQMKDTTFFPHDTERIAPTEEGVRGIVHDESARMFAKKRRAVGHAGLFSTVPDLLILLEALLQGKFPMIVEGAQKGLGWEVSREWMGKNRSSTTFGKTGFTGTSVVVDFEKGIGLVILSNRTYPSRPPNNAAINSFRADIVDIVFA